MRWRNGRLRTDAHPVARGRCVSSPATARPRSRAHLCAGVTVGAARTRILLRAAHLCAGVTVVSARTHVMLRAADTFHRLRRLDRARGHITIAARMEAARRAGRAGRIAEMALTGRRGDARTGCNHAGGDDGRPAARSRRGGRPWERRRFLTGDITGSTARRSGTAPCRIRRERSDTARCRCARNGPSCPAPDRRAT